MTVHGYTIARWRDSICHVSAVVLVTLVLAATPAVAQTESPMANAPAFEEYSRKSQVDIEKVQQTLRELQAQLDSIKNDLENGNIIVRNMEVIANTYKRYTDLRIKRHADCIELSIDADALQKKENPAWRRFAKKALDCQEKIKEIDELALKFDADFETVKTTVGHVKETIEALKSERDAALSEQQYNQSLRDFNESMGKMFDDFNTFYGSVNAF